MEIKLKDFIQKNEIVALLNFSGSFEKLKNNTKISYVTEFSKRPNMLVKTYLEKNIPNFSEKKFFDACKMVLLDSAIFSYNMKDISKTEMKKLQFVLALLLNSQTIVFQNFEEGFYGKSRSYYQKLFRKLTKYGKSILIFTNDVTFLFGLVSKCVLFSDEGVVWIDDFYDEKIYQYVSKPSIISYVNYLNKKNIAMEHYIESKEVLKAIYRSVTMRDSL